MDGIARIPKTSPRRYRVHLSEQQIHLLEKHRRFDLLALDERDDITRTQMERLSDALSVYEFQESAEQET